MKAAIRYQSRNGNTEKIAQAIAQELSIEGKTIDEPLAEEVDLLFLGGGVYAGKMDKALQRFVEALNPTKVKKVAVFSTAAGEKSLQSQVRELLAGKGIEVTPEAFQCPGKFLLANRDRPNAQDCAAAAHFARGLAQE